MNITSNRVFISHASEDKTLVRPLAQALAIEGLSLWLDRPGAGENNFQLEDDFVRRYDIQGLTTGRDWDDQILEAHRTCGAVLACISKSLSKDRQVLVQEMAFARYSGKLIACIVDEIEYQKLPSDLGLFDGSKLQAIRINVATIQEAVDHLQRNPTLSPDSFEGKLKAEWDLIRRLVAEINRVMRSQGVLSVSPFELDEARKKLREIPIGPMVRSFEIPNFLYELLSSRLPDAVATRQHFTLAMSLALQCADSTHTALQVIVSPGEVISPESNPLNQYWAAVLMAAGWKSRRTLAALIVTPGPLYIADLPQSTAQQLAVFLDWLKNPATPTTPQ